jgi:hypothetical protein
MESKGVQTDVVLKELAGLGVALKADALREYMKAGLGPKPLEKSRRGRGNLTIWPEETAIEVAVSFELVKEFQGHKSSIVAAREIAIEVETVLLRLLEEIRSETFPEHGKRSNLKAVEVFEQKPFFVERRLRDTQKIKELASDRDFECFLAGMWLKGKFEKLGREYPKSVFSALMNIGQGVDFFPSDSDWTP